MPSLVVPQNAHNEIYDFLVEEAAHCLVHFVTRLAFDFENDKVQSLL